MKRVLSAILILALILSLSGCVSDKNELTEIISQKISSGGRTQITVTVKYAFIINAFEEAAEKALPDIDIVQVGNYSGNMGTEEFEARLKNDDLTDVVMTWPLDIGCEYWKDRLLDLSGLTATNRYNTGALNSIMDGHDGKLYYLPGPSQVRGIVYNKTMFEANGWQVPSDFDGFVELCATIEKSGVRALQLGLKNSEVLDTAFVGFGFADSYASPKSVNALAQYNNGTGSFGDNFTPALETFQKLIDADIIRQSDLDVDYSDRENMLFSRQCAMAEDSVLLARMGADFNCNDEFALMPFFNPGGEDNDWARLYSVCYIGANKHLAEKQNKKKYDLVMKLLDYISTEEGQTALAGDTGAMFSSLKNVQPPNIPEIDALLNALQNGRYGVFPTLKNAQSTLRTGLSKMLSQGYEISKVIEDVDKQNVNPPMPQQPLYVGTASEDFTLIETAEFLADAMRKESGCDIALFMDNGKDGLYNGRGLSGRIYKGEIVSTDIDRIMPDFKSGENGILCKVKMTGANLLKTLEYSLSTDAKTVNWFYYFSGIRLEFCPTASNGSRIRKLTDENGKSLDMSKIYTVAVMEHTVSDIYCEEIEKTALLISDILEHAISFKTISPKKDGRMILKAN